MRRSGHIFENRATGLHTRLRLGPRAQHRERHEA